MGYFSNGEENADFQEEFCEHCIHMKDDFTGCPIMNIHWQYNYEQRKNNDVKSILEQLIPRKDVFNDKCNMFLRQELPREGR